MDRGASVVTGRPGIPVAGLPMYDWPEVRAEVDALWGAVATRIRADGLDAPSNLWRPDAVEDLWTHPDLLVAETCGFQVVGTLAGRVEVLGVLDHAVEGCRPGEYRSVLVCRADDPAGSLADLRGRPVAVNGRQSQSGHAVLINEVAPLADGGRFFGGVVETGAHRESMRAVAGGRADVAAIDEVCWRLGLDHEPAVDDLRVLGWTEPTPAPPLVTGWANGGLRDRLNGAVGEAVAGLDLAVREALHLYGYRPRSTSDYRVIADRLATAEATGYPTVA